MVEYSAGRDWVECSIYIIEKRPDDGIFGHFGSQECTATSNKEMTTASVISGNTMMRLDNAASVALVREIARRPRKACAIHPDAAGQAGAE